MCYHGDQFDSINALCCRASITCTVAVIDRAGDLPPGAPPYSSIDSLINKAFSSATLMSCKVRMKYEFGKLKGDLQDFEE